MDCYQQGLLIQRLYLLYLLGIFYLYLMNLQGFLRLLILFLWKRLNALVLFVFVDFIVWLLLVYFLSIKNVVCFEMSFFLIKTIS